MSDPSTTRRRTDPRFDLSPPNRTKWWHLRKKLNMTRARVAKALGLTPLSVYNYESGKFNPPDEIVEKYQRLEARAAKKARR